MARCPFATFESLSAENSGAMQGPLKIVHHTTEGSSAAGALEAFKKHRSFPHFTVDRARILQHIDTEVGARALRNAPGGVETNRGGAIQIELVGFAHKPKNPEALILLARLCRWLEQVHGIPSTWPAGAPKPARNGKDPGGHNRDPRIWSTQGGHYGHCHVPENTHWDPAYSAAEVDFLKTARFDAAGTLLTAPPPAIPAGASEGGRSTMPDHSHGQDADHREDHAEQDLDGHGGEGSQIPSLADGDAEADPAARPIHVGATGKTERKYNARADTLDFRDRMYEATLVEVPSTIPLERYLQHKVPVLDQGVEGACTGFGLATVAHYLLRRREYYPDPDEVSPRMLYELARRYDEWPGEDYEGSSARGAMKGWHKHGVCARPEWLDGAYRDPDDPGFDAKRLKGALRRPLGSYFRVNHKDLIAMHAAIAEVGILYATAVVHEGWEHVGEDGVIEFMDADIGAHAFAIVAYDGDGLWIQNSWGDDWGRKGMGRISYDDWLKNGTDVWVARLGAPVNLNLPRSFATAHSAAAGHSAAYAYAELRPYLISIGNDGRLRPGGDYGTSAREVATLFKRDIPTYFKDRAKKRLLVYAHGGLVSQEAAVQRISEYAAALADADVYPLALIWRTDYWTTITNILQDAVRRRRPEGVLDKTKDFLLDRLDDALEPLARQYTGKATWDEMKENARLSALPGGALELIAGHIARLKAEVGNELEIHLVGHSAGSILLAPLVQLLTAQGVFAGGPLHGMQGAGLSIDSCTLWAPACTDELFAQSYLPAIESGALANVAIYCLNDKAEQDDDCARIYNKSLLYLVSNALEERVRIPPSGRGVPLVGMEKTLRDRSTRVGQLVAGGKVQLVLAPNDHPADAVTASRARKHGSFDDDLLTVKSTFKRILGTSATAGASPATAVGELRFAASADWLIHLRKGIDNQTRRVQ